MNLKKIASLTALISFILEILTSVILYIVPQGKVAYWADWHLWGLSKTQWTDQHVNLGVLFLLAIVIHSYYNWPNITNYLKDRTRNLKIFTASFNLAIILSLIFCLGTYFAIPPFSTILDISSSIKDRGARTYGEPPYGHAELSTLKSFAKKTELDLDECLARFKAAGIKVANSEQTLAELAIINQTTPQKLYEIIRPDLPSKFPKGLPANPPSGVGRLSLAEISHDYGLDIAKVQKLLSEKGLQSTPDSTIKDIGAQYSRNPHDIYEIIADHFSGQGKN